MKNREVVVIPIRRGMFELRYQLRLHKRVSHCKPILEFPTASLQLNDITAEDAAIRILFDQTGWTGRTLKSSPKPSADYAGLQDVVIVELDGDSADNHTDLDLTILPLMTVKEIIDYINRHNDCIYVSNVLSMFLLGFGLAGWDHTDVILPDNKLII